MFEINDGLRVNLLFHRLLIVLKSGIVHIYIKPGLKHVESYS